MKRYAIIISVEVYKHFSPTPFAHEDSKLLSSTLNDLCDYSIQHTLLLNLTPDADKRPDEILSEIRLIVDGSEPGDTVLFYFAGHGHYSEDRSYLILPGTTPGAYERTALPLDDISKELRPPQRVCFRVFDSCHSGQDVRSNENVLDSNSFLRAITHDASGWVTLAACREDQYSHSDPKIGHGIFTYYFCDFIRSLKAEDVVLPELLKVGIVEKVMAHARQLGYTQTPTLNASISGNISLGVRRAETPKQSSVPESKNNDLHKRIMAIRSIEDMFTKAKLINMLEFLVASVKEEFENGNKLGGELSLGSQVFADDIPESMVSAVVDFSRGQGFQPRHELMRYESYFDEPPFGVSPALYSFFPNRKVRNVNCKIAQSKDLPKSAVILEIQGDARCVPTLKILIYVIPLQLTVCLLVSSFRQEWPPNDKDLEIMSHTYKILKPGTSPEQIKDLASSAFRNTIEKLQQHVATRLLQVEKELERSSPTH